MLEYKQEALFWDAVLFIVLLCARLIHAHAVVKGRQYFLSVCHTAVTAGRWFGKDPYYGSVVTVLWWQRERGIWVRFSSNM